MIINKIFVASVWFSLFTTFSAVDLNFNITLICEHDKWMLCGDFEILEMDTFYDDPITKFRSCYFTLKNKTQVFAHGSSSGDGWWDHGFEFSVGIRHNCFFDVYTQDTVWYTLPAIGIPDNATTISFTVDITDKTGKESVKQISTFGY